ncbi:hypothetical protein ACRBEV_10200 [Methylobacterium phyllosphaerae]
MAENALTGLQASRDRLIRERKILALRIANEKFKVEDIAGGLIRTQQALEVVEAAIAAEETAQGSVYDRRGLAGA